MTASPASSTSCGVVLLYHRVARVERDTHRLCVSPDAFASHAAYLASSCHPMSLEQLVMEGRAGTLPPRAAAVTFDDGYEDVGDALEVLAGRGIPATVFMTTDRIGAVEPYHYWWDQLEWAATARGIAGADIEVPSPEGPQRFRVGLDFGGAAAHHALHTALLPLDADARAHALAPISRLVAEHRPRLPRRMTAAELQTAATWPGISVGVHTVDHLFLPAHGPERQRFQIAASREALEGLLGRPVTTLAYPFGGWTAETVTSAAALGMSIAVTTDATPVTPLTDALLVPRVDVADCASTEAFERRLERLFATAGQH